jgi:hypothetical protein
MLIGAVLGAGLAETWNREAVFAQQKETAPAAANPQEQLAHLVDITPPASHPMVEAAMFAANLWFAGEKKNWPLANYYLGEARNRIRWEVKLNPGPKGADGKPVDMQSIFDGMDNGSIAALKKDITGKDSKQFAADYKYLLQDCYSCHKAAGRQYLRPMIPTSGAQPIINLDPNATWP